MQSGITFDPMTRWEKRQEHTCEIQSGNPTLICLYSGASHIADRLFTVDKPCGTDCNLQYRLNVKATSEKQPTSMLWTTDWNLAQPSTFACMEQTKPGNHTYKLHPQFWQHHRSVHLIISCGALKFIKNLHSRYGHAVGSSTYNSVLIMSHSRTAKILLENVY